MSLTLPAASIEFTRDEDGYWAGRVEPWGDRAYVLANIPENGSTFSSVFGAGDPWEDTTLRSAAFSESPNAARGILRLNYSNAPAQSSGQGNPSRERLDNTPSYSIRESGLDIPIEEVPGYKATWNHHLLTIEGETPWDGFDAVETPEVTDSGYRHTNKIIRYDQGYDRIDTEGNEWYISTPATKPGVDRKIIAGPQVVERRWFTSKTEADSFVAENRRGTKKAPGETFGIEGGEWLIWDTSLDPDGRRWEGMILYQWADQWDADLYD